MTKHIGIIAISSEGTALCYRTICQEARRVLGKFAHPEVSIHAHSLNRYMDFIIKDDWDGVASLMISSVEKLAAIGADFAICPDNTVHRSFEQVGKQARIPLISIIETVALECQLKEYQTVGVLGTRHTMQGPLYKEVLSKLEIDLVVPNENDQEIINNIIFDELIPLGRASSSSEKQIIGIIQRLKEVGCEAVILGCTEIPLLINNGNSPLPVIDSTRLLAKKALDYSLASDMAVRDTN